MLCCDRRTVVPTRWKQILWKSIRKNKESRSELTGGPAPTATSSAPTNISSAQSSRYEKIEVKRNYSPAPAYNIVHFEDTVTPTSTGFYFGSEHRESWPKINASADYFTALSHRRLNNDAVSVSDGGGSAEFQREGQRQDEGASLLTPMADDEHLIEANRVASAAALAATTAAAVALVGAHRGKRHSRRKQRSSRILSKRGKIRNVSKRERRCRANSSKPNSSSHLYGSLMQDMIRKLLTAGYRSRHNPKRSKNRQENSRSAGTDVKGRLERNPAQYYPSNNIFDTESSLRSSPLCMSSSRHRHHSSTTKRDDAILNNKQRSVGSRRGSARLETCGCHERERMLGNEQILWKICQRKVTNPIERGSKTSTPKTSESLLPSRILQTRRTSNASVENSTSYNENEGNSCSAFCRIDDRYAASDLTVKKRSNVSKSTVLDDKGTKTLCLCRGPKCKDEIQESCIPTLAINNQIVQNKISRACKETNGVNCTVLHRACDNYGNFISSKLQSYGTLHAQLFLNHLQKKCSSTTNFEKIRSVSSAEIRSEKNSNQELNSKNGNETSTGTTKQDVVTADGECISTAEEHHLVSRTVQIDPEDFKLRNSSLSGDESFVKEKNDVRVVTTERRMEQPRHGPSLPSTSQNKERKISRKSKFKTGAETFAKPKIPSKYTFVFRTGRKLASNQMKTTKKYVQQTPEYLRKSVKKLGADALSVRPTTRLRSSPRNCTTSNQNIVALKPKFVPASGVPVQVAKKSGKACRTHKTYFEDAGSELVSLFRANTRGSSIQSVEMRSSTSMPNAKKTGHNFNEFWKKNIDAASRAKGKGARRYGIVTSPESDFPLTDSNNYLTVRSVDRNETNSEPQRLSSSQQIQKEDTVNVRGNPDVTNESPSTLIETTRDKVNNIASKNKPVLLNGLTRPSQILPSDVRLPKLKRSDYSLFKVNPESVRCDGLLTPPNPRNVQMTSPITSSIQVRKNSTIDAPANVLSIPPCSCKLHSRNSVSASSMVPAVGSYEDKVVIVKSSDDHVGSAKNQDSHSSDNNENSINSGRTDIQDVSENDKVFSCIDVDSNDSEIFNLSYRGSTNVLPLASPTQSTYIKSTSRCGRPTQLPAEQHVKDKLCHRKLAKSSTMYEKCLNNVLSPDLEKDAGTGVYKSAAVLCRPSVASKSIQESYLRSEHNQLERCEETSETECKESAAQETPDLQVIVSQSSLAECCRMEPRDKVYDAVGDDECEGQGQPYYQLGSLTKCDPFERRDQTYAAHKSEEEEIPVFQQDGDEMSRGASLSNIKSSHEEYPVNVEIRSLQRVPYKNVPEACYQVTAGSEDASTCRKTSAAPSLTEALSNISDDSISRVKIGSSARNVHSFTQSAVCEGCNSHTSRNQLRRCLVSSCPDSSSSTCYDNCTWPSMPSHHFSPAGTQHQLCFEEEPKLKLNEESDRSDISPKPLNVHYAKKRHEHARSQGRMHVSWESSRAAPTAVCLHSRCNRCSSLREEDMGIRQPVATCRQCDPCLTGDNVYASRASSHSKHPRCSRCSSCSKEMRNCREYWSPHLSPASSTPYMGTRRSGIHGGKCTDAVKVSVNGAIELLGNLSYRNHKHFLMQNQLDVSPSLQPVDADMDIVRATETHYVTESYDGNPVLPSGTNYAAWMTPVHCSTSSRLLVAPGTSSSGSRISNDVRPIQSIPHQTNVEKVNHLTVTSGRHR